MKWLLILVVVVVIVAALWLRSARQTASATSHRPHRLDDSLHPSASAEADEPVPPARDPGTT